MYINIFISLLLIFLFPNYAYAEGNIDISPETILKAKTSIEKTTCYFDKPISLEDAIEYAINNYPSIKAANARYNRENLKVPLAKTAYIPQFNIFSQTNKANNAKLPGAVFPQTGVIPIQGATPEKTDNRFAWGTWDGGLLDWILTDFGLRKSKVNQAKVAPKVALADKDLTLFEVVNKTANTFFDAIKSDELVKISQANLEQAEKIYLVLTTLANCGLIPQIEEYKANAILEEAKTNLNSAKKQREVAYYSFSKPLGLAGHLLAINPCPFNKPINDLPDKILCQSITTAHPELKYQIEKIELIKANKDVISHSYLPEISLQNVLNGRGSQYAPGAIFRSGNYGLRLLYY